MKLNNKYYVTSRITCLRRFLHFECVVNYCVITYINYCVVRLRKGI